MYEPTLGQRFRLPSTSVVEVTHLFEAAMVGCHYVFAAWPRKRKGASAKDGDLRLSLEFLKRHAEADK